MRRRLVLLAAASPLCLAAGAAQAETVISTTTTTPVATATAAGGSRDDIKVTSAGAVNPTGGTAITLNSSNTVTLEGGVKIQNADDAIAIRALGGNTGDVKLSGSIQVDETTEIKDTDSDGDNDGPFATGARRYGVRVTGASPFDGSILQTAGAITVEGNDSAGVSAESYVVGALRLAGTTAVTGDRTFGVHTMGRVGGDVQLTGAITAQGKDAIGVATDDAVGGRLTIGSSVISTGYRYTTRGTDAVVAKLDADDLLQGGPAVRVRGDVLGGLLVDASGSATSYGGAGGMVVGSADRDIRLGVVGTGVDAYGLLVKGAVQGAGVYDGIAGSALQLGSQGRNVTIDGGVRLTGTVQATAAKAGAVAIHVGSGTTTPSLINADGTIKAAVGATDAVNARAVQIDSGASVRALYNSGTISAAIVGTKGSAAAVVDASGTLREITNVRTISATITPSSSSDTVTGERVALDLRANTSGVTVLQAANASTEVTPAIIGDVLFGSGRARLLLNAGTLSGDVAFGTGDDVLTIDGGAKMTGALTDAGGGLTTTVTKGTLNVTNAAVINMSSLTVGSTGQVVFTADPATGAATQFNVAGVASLATGAKVGLNFASKLSSPASYALIRAGALNAGTLSQSSLGDTPFLYKAELRVDAAQNALFADVRRRTSAELGLTTGEAGALEAVFASFDRDAEVGEALLSKTDASGFAALYDQFLPDYHGGLFQALATASDATSRAVDEGEGQLRADGLRLWTQEIAFLVRRDLDRSSKYDADGFGIAGGIEAPDTSLGVLGLSTSFINLNVDEDAAAAAESLTGSTFAAGVYWREDAGDLSAALSLSGGYAWLKSKRAVVDGDNSLSRLATAEWNGATVAAHAGLSYRLRAGSFFAKPQVTADYFLFKEDGRTETGGGDSVNLEVDERSSSQLSAFAGVTFGARFGEESALVWVPELTAGWRQVSGDGADATTARFVAGGPTFTLSAPDLSGGGPVVRLAIRGQGEYFDFAIEAGGEIRDDYEAYDGRFVARFLF